MISFSFSKSKIAIISLLTIMLLALGFIISGLPANVSYAEEKESTTRTINVAGSAIVTAPPDMAYINFGVVTEDIDAKKAQQKNANTMNKVIEAIKQAGIAEKDIKTINYRIHPKYDYTKESGTSKIVGYSVNNSVEVTIRDIDETGAIIDVVADSGANTASNIRFALSNNEEYYNQALEEALKNAKGKAQTIADVLEVKLDLPVSVNEQGSYSPVYKYAEVLRNDMAASTPVESGSIQVSANVNVSYEIKE